jgi:hypothetical protein
LKWERSEDLYTISSIWSGSNKLDGTQSLKSSGIRSATDTLGLLNNGFKYYDRSARGFYGAGFAYRETAEQLSARTFKNTTSTYSQNNEELLSLTDGRYTVGDVVNDGYINTLKVVAHRNKVIQSNLLYGYDVDGDGAINDICIPANFVSIPKSSGNTSEMDDLANACTILASAASDFGFTNDYEPTQIMHCAASACYAYEPNVPNLSDKFKKHNWFLPQSGHLTRIFYYTQLATSNGDVNIFDVPFFDSFEFNKYYYSSQPYSTHQIFGMSVSSVSDATAQLFVSKGQGSDDCRYRPICAF